MRAYLLATLVDDIGIATSIWPWQRLLTDLFVDQRARASLMIPALLCFLAGNVIAGPLADWPSTGRTRLALGHWRWRTVLAGRSIETFALGSLMLAIAGQPATIASITPYFLVSAFMKTALRPTRIAWEVDLLDQESPRVDLRTGETLLDEAGRALKYKTHLLTFSSMTALSSAVATLFGLVGGGWLLSVLGDRVWIAFAIDVLTNICFIAIIARYCLPNDRSETLLADGDASQPPRLLRYAVNQFFGSMRDAFRYLATKEQRPLVCLLIGGALIELVSEFYDGRMIVRHLLHGDDDDVRYAQIAWSVTGMVAVVLLPMIAQSLKYLGRIFLVIMVIDGVMLVFAGGLAASGSAATLPFVLVLAGDHGLTQASSTLMGVAQSSASSAAMRGRIAATYAFFVLVLALVAEDLATGISEAIGIPRMITWLGFGQLVLMALIAALGAGALWRFGIVTDDESVAGGVRPATERRRGLLRLYDNLRWFRAARRAEREDAWDDAMGTDTGGFVTQLGLGVAPEVRRHAHEYMATLPRTFGAIVQTLPIAFEDYTFIDLGCGKGRTLLLAAQRGFRRVIGVEISPALCEIAQSNASHARIEARSRATIEVRCSDAAEFEFPPGPLVIYLFHAFDGEVLARVLARLRAAVARDPRPVYFAYLRPENHALLRDGGDFVLHAESPPRSANSPEWSWNVYVASEGALHAHGPRAILSPSSSRA